MAALSPAHRQGCARLGSARLQAFRLNVFEATGLASINGVPVAGAPGTGLRIDGASIDQILNDQVDTASFRARGFVPVAGQTIAVYSGDTTPEAQLFGGRILATTQLYESRKEHRAHDLRCVDPTWLLNRRTVLAQYVWQSATTIVQDLITRFARGVTTRAVVAGLPVIDEITFTNEYLPVCFTAIAERIGGHWYLDYASDLHVFLSEAPDANAITDAAPHGAADLQLTEDLSQVVTKVIGRGGGGKAAIDLPAGQTELPVDTAVWYPDSGGLVEVGPQVLTYTGVRGRAADTGQTTAGALVGTGNAPAVPTVWLASSFATLPAGTYGYTVTFLTATGETAPGASATRFVPGTQALPMTVAPPVRTTGTGTSGMTPGGSYRYRVAVQFYGGGMTWTPPSAAFIADGKWQEVFVGTAQMAGGVFTPYAYYYPDLGQTFQSAPIAFTNLYRTTNGGSTYYLVKQYVGAAIVAGYALDNTNVSDASLVFNNQLPLAIGALNSVFLTNLPVGASGSGVTGRKLYRTPVNAAPLKLLTTLADNTTTTHLDTAADATLGANAPMTDTSGISDNRVVPPGAITIPVSSTAPFEADGGAAGGWVRVGTVPVRYTTIGVGILTGIPVSGVGALITPVRYGTQIVVQPRLIGVAGLTRAVARGDTVTIRLEVLDAAARDLMAARLVTPDVPVTADDGVIEIVVSDSRFTLTELQDHVDATLLERKDPQRTLTFTSRDLSLQVGRLITVTTSQPPISGTFRIHKIGLSEIAIAGGRATVHPLKTVEASSRIYTFTDLLRRLRSLEAGVH